MERKTHRESWKGEESVKDRIVLEEPQVVPFLEASLTLEQALADLDKKGKNENEKKKFAEFFSEVQRAVDSKQLRPMIRTQYMRTAFQIPFDSTVRVSLDTNLCMIKENPEDAPSCHESGRWRRDPALPTPRTEITRFPHAVLEVKLSLHQGEEAPEWIKELLESGYLTEVHKFSKFIHGSATLMPDMVQAVPYWVDDESVRPSMLMSAPAPMPLPAPSTTTATAVAAAAGGPRKPRKRTGNLEELHHPLLGDEPTLQLLPDRSEVAGLGPDAARKRGGFLSRWFLSRQQPKAEARLSATIPQRIEPKTFFANERTFLSWLHMAVTIGSIGAALLGFSGSAPRNPHASTTGVGDTTDIIAMILLPVAVLMCAYALVVFLWRSGQIARKQVGYIDDQNGPLCLAVVVVLALSGIFIVSAVDFVQQLRSHT
jgi:uncharacterized membrane protein YidH (DUF202 family)